MAKVLILVLPILFTSIVNNPVRLWQSRIEFGSLTDLRELSEGEFGVIYRARHPHWGPVIYKQLKSSTVADASRFILSLLFVYYRAGKKTV